MQQFYANGLAMASKMDWKEERSLITPLAIGGTFPADTRQIRVRFSAFRKPFFRKCVHKLKIWGHLFRTRVPLLEKRDPFLKRGVRLLVNRYYNTQIGVPFLSLCDTLSAKRIPFFAKCVPLLGKRDSILGRSDRTFITSGRYLATCVPLSEKRDPILGERDHTFITSERYFATGGPLLVKCDPYFATCVPVSGKRTSVWQKSDIQISKRVHGESICVPRKRKTVPKKALFCVISSRKSLQASDLITTQAQPKNDLRITQERPKVDPSLTQETAKDDLRLTQPRPSLRTAYKQGSPKDDTTNTQETANNDTRNATLMYRECTVSVRGVYRKGTGEVLKRYWRATKDLLNACTSGVDQLYGKSRRVVEPMRSKAIPLMAVWLCFMLFNLSDAWAQSAEPRTAEGQTEIKPLKIGDTISEELWEKSFPIMDVNGDISQSTLQKYKEGVIVFDFWGTWCGQCIAGFPDLFSLRSDFEGEDVLFIPVVRQKEEVVRKTIAKPSISSIANFETIIDPDYLFEFFPSRGVPNLVVINKGKVEAITKAEFVTKEAITALLEDRFIYLPRKRDATLMEGAPLLVPQFSELKQYRPIYYSALTGYQDGVLPHVQFQETRDYTRWFIPNATLWSMYKYALDDDDSSEDFDFYSFPNRRVILADNIADYFDSKVVMLYPKEERRAVYRKYYFTYDMWMQPGCTPEEMRTKLFNDLNAFLGYDVAVEDVPMKCWVLFDDRRGEEPTDTKTRMQRANVFIRYLNHPTFGLPPVVADAAAEKLPKIDLESRVYDRDELNKILSRYKLRLEEEIRPLKMLVVRDKNNNVPLHPSKLQPTGYGYMLTTNQ